MSDLSPGPADYMPPWGDVDEDALIEADTELRLADEMAREMSNAERVMRFFDRAMGT